MIVAFRKYAGLGFLLSFWIWMMSIDDIRDGLGDVSRAIKAGASYTIGEILESIDLGNLEWN